MKNIIKSIKQKTVVWLIRLITVAILVGGTVFPYYLVSLISNLYGFVSLQNAIALLLAVVMNVNVFYLFKK